MRLLVIGIGNPIPPFIQRRLLALQRFGVELILVAEYGQHLPGFEKATVVYGRRLGKAGIIDWVRLVLRTMLRPGTFVRLSRLCPKFDLLNRVKWVFLNYPVACIPPVDVIHIQWINQVVAYRWLKKFQQCSIIASARGSQVTIYPVTRPGQVELLSEAFTLVDHIHCVSNDIARRCRDLGAPLEKLMVNYNGVDVQSFAPKGQKLEIFTLVSIGGLVWRKGLWYQLLLMKKLISSGRRVQLILVGDGPDREGLTYTASALGITDFVKFVGKVQGLDVGQYLSRAHVYISTSAAEGLANSVLEAAASGLPIVCFQCEGMGDVVRDGKNGFLVAFGDIDKLTTRVISLMNSPQIREEMGQRSRNLAAGRFSDEYWVSEMITFYRSCAKR